MTLKRIATGTAVVGAVTFVGACSGSTSATGVAVGAPTTAASGEISPALSGTCSALGGARTPGARPLGAAGDATPPAGTPNPGRTRGPGAGGNGFGGFGAFGKVTAVNSASFTVERSDPQGGSANAAVPTTQTAETSAATTYTRTRAANAKALAVGLYVTALGEASDTGSIAATSIAATSIALRPAENGSCSSGLGRRGSGGVPNSTGGGSGA
ncbi:MAG: hypothetical protein ACYCV4_09680 [Dermatophilaceae bacterium]